MSQIMTEKECRRRNRHNPRKLGASWEISSVRYGYEKIDWKNKRFRRKAYGGSLGLSPDKTHFRADDGSTTICNLCERQCVDVKPMPCQFCDKIKKPCCWCGCEGGQRAMNEFYKQKRLRGKISNEKCKRLKDLTKEEFLKGCGY